MIVIFMVVIVMTMMVRTHKGRGVFVGRVKREGMRRRGVKWKEDIPTELLFLYFIFFIFR